MSAEGYASWDVAARINEPVEEWLKSLDKDAAKAVRNRLDRIDNSIKQGGWQAISSRHALPALNAEAKTMGIMMAVIVSRRTAYRVYFARGDKPQFCFG